MTPSLQRLENPFKRLTFRFLYQRTDNRAERREDKTEIPYEGTNKELQIKILLTIPHEHINVRINADTTTLTPYERATVWRNVKETELSARYECPNTRTNVEKKTLVFFESSEMIRLTLTNVLR